MRHPSESPVQHVLKHHRLFSAISASLVAGTTTGVQAQEQEEALENILEEVIVTARKRDENIQDIPQSIQAFSQQDIAKIGIKGLDDVAKMVPALTVVGSTAGLNKIVFRGLADSVRPYIADSSAAIYLDEQPLTTGAQSPEIRPIDMERIETLAGPQGTLYGASSQSGTIRYIVNKPDVSSFASNVGAGVHQVSSGDMGWDADAMINIPLIQDTLALRLVGFGAKDAGYIDNVLGNTPGRIDFDTGERVIGSKDNSDIAGKDVNDADWKGARVSAKWQVNEAWSLTGIYNYSDSEIHGFNDYDPTTGDLQTVKFHRESWNDDWSNFQFTIDGDLGFAQLTSSTSYFERDTQYIFDATSGVAYYHSVLGAYGRGSCATGLIAYADYYGNVTYYNASYWNIYDFATACELNGTGYDVDDGDPTGLWRNDQKDERWTHETRLSGSTGRWDWTAGIFYQEADQDWIFGTYIDDYTQTESFAAYEAMYGPLEPTDIRWASREVNSRTDKAVFGEATFSITEEWKLLLGARWYDAEVDRRYTLSVPATAPADVALQGGDDDGWLPKLGLQYFWGDDKMVYALYSEGFRTGGSNRARGTPTLPIQYESDLLKNYEAGLKSRWAGGKVQLNVIGYHQAWEDMQLELTDPSYAYGEPYQTVIANVGDAVVDGVDVEISALVGDGWSVGAVATYLFTAEIDEDIQVSDERDPPGEYALDIPAGTRLPLVADLNLTAWTEFTWGTGWFGDAQAYVRLQYAYTDTSFNRLVDAAAEGSEGVGYGARVQQPDYSTWDLRSGLNGDNWELSLYVDNFTDERQVYYHDMNADVFWGRDNIRTGQPRTYGVNYRHYFTK